MRPKRQIFIVVATFAASLLLAAAPAGAVALFPNLMSVQMNQGTPFDVSDEDLLCQAGEKSGVYNCDGLFQTIPGGGGNWEISNWQLAFDQDPQISPNFSFKNLTGATQTFTLRFVIPVTNFGPATNMGGSMGGSVTDADFSGTGGLSTVGAQALYSGIIDGALVVPNAVLHPAVFAVNFAFAGNSPSIASTSFGLPGVTQPGPALTTNIGIEFKFSLSSMDSVGITSFFRVEPIPEPSTALLLGGGLLALMGAARRIRRS